jgi:hypothetical protein
MSNEDDRFFRELGSIVKRFPAKSITLIFSSILFLFGIGWSTSKLLTAPAGIRERAAVEDAFRKHNISLPNQSDVVALIQIFSDELKKKGKKNSNLHKQIRNKSERQEHSSSISRDSYKKKPIIDKIKKQEALEEFKVRLKNLLVSQPEKNLSEDILRKIYFEKWINGENALLFKKELDKLIISKDPVISLDYFIDEETITDVRLIVRVKKKSGSHYDMLLKINLVGEEYYATHFEEK